MRGKTAALTAILAIVVFATVAARAEALGIAPAKKTIEFEPNKTINLTYRVYNSEGIATKVKVELGGALKETGKAVPETIDFEEGSLVKLLRVEIRFGKEPPRERTGSITLSNQNSGGTVNAGLKISAQINIKVKENMVTGAATTQTEEKKEEVDKEIPKKNEDNKEEKNKWKTWLLLAGFLALLGANAVMLTRKKTEEETVEETRQTEENAEEQQTENKAIEEIEREIERLKQL